MRRPKTLLMAAVIIGLPALLALLMRSAPRREFDPVMAYNVLSSLLIFGFLLVILCVVFGTGVITQEVEQKTIVYLLTRPVPRWRIALVKFVAACLLISMTVWAATLLLALATYGPARLKEAPLGRDMAILPIGVLAYGSVSLLLATLMARPLILGLLYAFIWESWVPNLSGDFEKLSLMAYVRTLAPHAQPEQETTPLTELLSAAASQTITPTFAWRVLLGVTGVALGLALFFFSTREYVPREETT